MIHPVALTPASALAIAALSVFAPFACRASAADSTLYLQPMSPNGGVLRASQFWIDPSGNNDLDSDAIAWENFTFAQDSTVTRVRWWGDAPPPLGFKVSFFNQDPNTVALQPDIFASGSAPISVQNFPSPQAQSAGGSLYQFTVDLTTPVSFEAGKRYFVSVLGQTPVPFAEWRWAASPTANLGTFWWLRGAHMYYHLGDDRALELVGAPGPALSMAYDGFDGPPRPDLHGSTAGTGWTNAWQDQAYDTITSVGGLGLTYSGLDTSPGAAVTEVGGSPYPLSTYARSFGSPPQASTKIYVSFLMRAEAGHGAGGGVQFGNYPNAMTVGAPFDVYQFGLLNSEGLGDLSNEPLVEGDTNLVVVRISKNPSGTGLIYSMYLNPAIGQAEPSSPLAQYGISAVSALPTSLKLHNGGGFSTDEIRVGTTWASVLPAEPGCLGDLHLDGTVNGADLGVLLSSWGQTGGDLNEDGTTDGADLGELLAAWGPCQ